MIQTTFRRLPSFDILLRRGLHIGVVGAPFNKGQPKPGVVFGPRSIRQTNLIEHLQQQGHDVKDYGDVEMTSHGTGELVGGCRQGVEVLDYTKQLSRAVQQTVLDKRVCLTLGGDHSIAMGTISGHARALLPHQELVTLWIDAHADINTGSSSVSGNMHGMPVAFLLHEMQHLIEPELKEDPNFPEPSLKAANIVYLGLRDVEAGEKKVLEDLGIVNYDMQAVSRHGTKDVISRIIKHLNLGPDRPLHISFDIDSLDPLEAPSTGTPVRGGLMLREVLQLLEAVREEGHLSAVDIVEVNPELGSHRDALGTADAARLVALSLLSGYRGF
ncbi:arginase, hepatic-like [Oratosquilla oratoria]|uniref:arginase, hepatic-like n=1 Tax=Oratosquilla oratoria TaxID=337810 RepID=UPI003F76E310